MKINSDILFSDGGIQILVSYQYDKEGAYEAEPGNPSTRVAASVYIELLSVEIILGGRGINITQLLHASEREFIISKVNV